MPGRWLGLVRQSGAANVDWLIGVAEQLLVDAGLIGLPRGDLRAHAGTARGGCRSRGAPLPAIRGRKRCARAAFDGLSGNTSFYDLLRAIWAGLGHAARDGYAALGLQPAEVRLADTGALGSLARPVLGACLGAPLRLIEYLKPRLPPAPRWSRRSPSVTTAIWSTALPTGSSLA